MPFKYYSIFFALIFVYAVFEETPRLQMLIGVGIVIAASFIILLPKAWQLTDPARPSTDKEDALDGVDKDLAGTV